MEGEKSFLMPIIVICVGIYILWCVKNKSNQSEYVNKMDRIFGWILIGGALGYLIWAPDYYY